MKGYDSAALIPLDDPKAQAATVIAGYLNRGLITKAYIDKVFATGRVFLPILETDGTPGNNNKVPDQFDYDDGANQGRWALADLQRLGYPNLGCVFTDDVSGSPYPEVRQWALGVASTFPNFRVFYGPGDKGDQLVDEGIFHAVWLEGAMSFTPRGYVGRHYCGVQLDDQGQFRQETVGGVLCDVNTFYSTPWVPGSAPTPSPTGDWFDMATLDDLKAALQDDAVLSAIARKVREELNGTLDAERAGRGEPQGRGPNLGAVVRTLTENHADAPTIKDNVERIVNATGAHS